MTNKLKQSKIFVSVAAFFLVIVIATGCYYFLKLSSAQEELEQQKQRLNSKKSTLASLEQIKEQGNLEEQLTLFREVIPNSPKKDDFIDLLYSSAPPDGDIHQLKIDRVIEHDDYGAVPVNFTYIGRYGEVIQLINNLNEDNRMVTIFDIDIAEGEEGYPQVNASIYAKIYFSKGDNL
ncbi:type 4a pilus biogenesis protein PilO [Natranaerobius trueperi]|uniref:Pilus assembly protein PilO n=1 Tax=Natranaerobius trueperi TaxID=759412 RepID=A0A226C013_9FIRM|nr:type 4a pilus biogenesis protein PilO [Natranaerobius trueperi]OWZ84638.1 hypothetical protein CDO51_02435 [Natranaerobius trueperi]